MINGDRRSVRNRQKVKKSGSFLVTDSGGPDTITLFSGIISNFVVKYKLSFYKIYNTYNRGMKEILECSKCTPLRPKNSTCLTIRSGCWVFFRWKKGILIFITPLLPPLHPKINRKYVTELNYVSKYCWNPVFFLQLA